MRTLTYYIATTLDGFIAREDGSFGEFPWDDEFGAHILEQYPETFPAHLRGDGYTKDDNRVFDVVLMGRSTYEVGLDAGVTCPYPTLDQYVFSRSMSESPDPAVTLVRDGATDLVRDLKEQDGRGIWLCGGAALASALMDAALIDRLVVKLNPVVFGSGIPLFSRPVRGTEVTLEGHRAFASGHVILEYGIAPSRAESAAAV